MLAGTPVVTTDFGAFPELVREGFNGYRFRTLGEAVSATKEAMELNRGEIKEWARNNFSIDRVRYQYQAYFEQLLEMWDKGWYSELSTSREYDRYKRI
jgi:glycosyltransferase involved in cell wall biosynthesis